MTPRIFELPIPSVIVVELQPAADRFTIFNDSDRPYLSYFTGVDTHRAYLPDGSWQLIGRLSEVTEEQIANVVGRGFDNYRVCQKLNQQSQYDMYWVRHPDGKCTHFDTKGDCYSFALKMELKHAIKAAGLFTENPHGTEKQHKKAYTGHDMFFIEHMRKWHDAQQRTICPERTVVLQKVK